MDVLLVWHKLMDLFLQYNSLTSQEFLQLVPIVLITIKGRIKTDSKELTLCLRECLVTGNSDSDKILSSSLKRPKR